MRRLKEKKELFLQGSSDLLYDRKTVLEQRKITRHQRNERETCIESIDNNEEIQTGFIYQFKKLLSSSLIRNERNLKLRFYEDDRRQDHGYISASK